MLKTQATEWLSCFTIFFSFSQVRCISLTRKLWAWHIAYFLWLFQIAWVRFWSVKQPNKPSTITLHTTYRYYVQRQWFSCWEKTRNARPCWHSPPTCCKAPDARRPWTCWQGREWRCWRILHCRTSPTWSYPAIRFARTPRASRNLLYLKQYDDHNLTTR